MIKKEVNFNNTEINCNYHVISEFTVKEHSKSAECRVRSYVSVKGIEEKKNCLNEIYLTFNQNNFPFDEVSMKENNLNHKDVLYKWLVDNHDTFKDGQII